MLRRTILLHILFVCWLSLDAQEGTNTELGVEAGVRILSQAKNMGLFLNAEPHLRFSDHASIGLRMGVAI